MKLLLDTHAALWWLADDDRIGEDVIRHLTDDTNQVLISAVVVWEVAIKRSLGKLEAPDDLAPTLLGAGAQPLPVTLDHAAAVENCPGTIAIRWIGCSSPRLSSKMQRSCRATSRSPSTESRSSGSNAVCTA